MSGRTSGPGWYLKRARVMGPAEILHRVQERVAIGRLRVGQLLRPRLGAPIQEPQRLAFCAATIPQLPSLPWAFDPTPEDVERLLGGDTDAFGTGWVWRDDPLVWHEAPDTGRVWPRRFFSTIPYRAGNPYGDVRVVWEPSRLQHLVPLGLLAARRADDTGDRAANLLARQLCSWVDANPPYVGVHYVSAMECGLRIIAACHAVDLARGWYHDAPRVWAALVTLVDGHARLIESRLSRYSSAGNHTIGECAGLVYAGVLFPELPGAANWLATGTALLEQEARRQILPDGGGLEQAWWYLAFVVDLCGLVAAALRHRGIWVSPVIRYAHTRGREFLRAFADGPEALPAIGDADNGFALSSRLRFSWQGRSSHRPGLTTFKDAGYSIVRADDDVLIFDHGPLGMPPSYGHGHADALSIIWRRGGRDVLIDPGTYTYTGDPGWRAYFRGTAAHNTVMVDEQDQAVQETAFQWSRPYATALVRSEQRANGEIALLARHDGYTRRGVEHWRGVLYRPGNAWLVWDLLRGAGVHRVDLHWHAGGEVSVRPAGVRLSGTSPPASLVVSGGSLSVLHGAVSPISGWRSRHYGRKEPMITLRARFDGALPHEFVTRLLPGDPTPESPDDHEAVAEFRTWVANALLRQPGLGQTLGPTPRHLTCPQRNPDGDVTCRGHSRLR